MNTILTTYAIVITVLILGTIVFLLVSGKYKRNDNLKRLFKKSKISKSSKKPTLKGGAN